MSVSVVLPCYNEEESVGLCIEEALDTMRAAGIDGEVVVVDNNCTDDSAAVALQAGAASGRREPTRLRKCIARRVLGRPLRHRHHG